MIKIKKKSELDGAEQYGQCANCAKDSSQGELYQLLFGCENAELIKSSSMDLCFDCMMGLGSMLYDMYELRVPH